MICSIWLVKLNVSFAGRAMRWRWAYPIAGLQALDAIMFEVSGKARLKGGQLGWVAVVANKTVG